MVVLCCAAAEYIMLERGVHLFAQRFCTKNTNYIEDLETEDFENPNVKKS